ncbi:MAG: nuclear transport factor 2 family protein [Saprospiraceae bacterium]|nr:nuclear transport factor 2 family protein [Saprospiraceae bacterium]
MKNTFFHLLACCALALFTQTSYAQTAKDEADLKVYWKNIWEAYQAGNTEAMWAAYTEDAEEITPDGNLTQGKKALREGWEAFMKMVDAPPTFTYESPSVRFLTPDVAILTWDSSADIKIHGQQIGGKTKGMAVVHRIEGHWRIEFDSMTPVMTMPGN